MAGLSEWEGMEILEGEKSKMSLRRIHSEMGLGSSDKQAVLSATMFDHMTSYPINNPVQSTCKHTHSLCTYLGGIYYYCT